MLSSRARCASCSSCCRLSLPNARGEERSDGRVCEHSPVSFIPLIAVIIDSNSCDRNLKLTHASDRLAAYGDAVAVVVLVLRLVLPTLLGELDVGVVLAAPPVGVVCCHTVVVVVGVGGEKVVSRECRGRDKKPIAAETHRCPQPRGPRRCSQ